MIYDPKALPFWEIARDSGPILNHRRTVDRVKRKRIRRNDYSPRDYNFGGFDGCGNRWVSAGKRVTS